jgi:DnaJ-class molecular chaperone
LELHPDKNKSPTAIEDFRKVKQAFDVLSDPETRRIYEKFGDYGVKLSSQSVMDHKVIIIQMVVYYSSSAILAFLMTFSEPTGDAFSASMFGMAGTHD